RTQPEYLSRWIRSIRLYCQNAGAIRKKRKLIRKKRKQIRSKRIGRQATDHTKRPARAKVNRLGTVVRFTFTRLSFEFPSPASRGAVGVDLPFHTPRANAPRAKDPLAHRCGPAGLRLSNATPGTPPRRNVSRDRTYCR